MDAVRLVISWSLLWLVLKQFLGYGAGFSTIPYQVGVIHKSPGKILIVLVQIIEQNYYCST